METTDQRYRFANLTEPIKTVSIFIYDVTLPIADNWHVIIAYLSVIGLFVNFFHIFILSRKSMRQSSVNALMIGQSISDIICFFYKIRDIPVIEKFLNNNNNNECDPPDSYFRVLGLFSFFYADSIFRRVSPWIGVVMAAFRLLITSFPFNDTIGKLGNPISSLCSILILSVISTALSAPFYMQITVKNQGQWVPEENCGYPEDYSLDIYGLDDKYEYDFEEGYYEEFLLGTTGFVSLPPILLPFLTIGLIRVLKKNEKKRAQLSSQEVTRHKTTKLVVIMTVCLMVTEVPYHVSDTFLSYINEWAAILIARNIYSCFAILYPLNSIAHCFINMMLSSEYRKCVEDVMPCVFRSENTQSRNNGSTGRVGNSTRNATTRMI